MKKILIFIGTQRKNKNKPRDSVPSIPSKHNKMLFFSKEDSQNDDEISSGPSVIKRIKNQNKEDKDNKDVSPFTYDPDVNKIKKNIQGAGWSLLKSKRNYEKKDENQSKDLFENFRYWARKI